MNGHPAPGLEVRQKCATRPSAPKSRVYSLLLVSYAIPHRTMRIRPNWVEIFVCGVLGVMLGLGQITRQHVNLFGDPGYFLGCLIGTFIGVLSILLAIKTVVVLVVKLYRAIGPAKN